MDFRGNDMKRQISKADKEKARELAADAIRRIVDAAEDLTSVQPILAGEVSRTVIDGQKHEASE